MSIDKENVIDWAENVSFAVTICDCKGYVVYANEKAQATFAKYGPLIGRNLKDCHQEKSWLMINKLIDTKTSNSYTILKNGVKKLIHQTPWYEMKDGEKVVGGMVEVSIELPNEMDHFIR